MPSYSANARRGGSGSGGRIGGAIGAIGNSIRSKARSTASSVGSSIKKGFANAVRPREGFIRPSSVDIEQDIRDIPENFRETFEVVTDVRVEIVTGETTDDGGPLAAETRKTARFESSFGGFQIF